MSWGEGGGAAGCRLISPAESLLGQSGRYWVLCWGVLTKQVSRFLESPARYWPCQEGGIGRSVFEVAALLCLGSYSMLGAILFA